MSALHAPRIFTSATATGAVYDHGAHVVDWTPAGHSPVLWMSSRSHFDTEHPIRGGVPICFPWFGSGASGTLAPAHGSARISEWTMCDIFSSADASGAAYQLVVDASEAFPQVLHARYDVRFGRELDLSFTVTNPGAEPCVFEEALHTYLAVGDIHRVRIEGLAGCTYLDKVPGADPRPQVQQGDIVFTAETDRIYSSSGTIRVVDEAMRRVIVVERTGSANAVVWNPWVAKSAAMPDFGDDEWPEMLCVEGANLRDDAITLAPGASHTMGYRLSIESLA